jgi:hypothetical protein
VTRGRAEQQWWAGPGTDGIEAAVVQVMTYLVENEQAALVVPARVLARVHPHLREVQHLLAVQAADEARHVEVFTRRALLHGAEMGTSSAGGRDSLGTLLTEPDFSPATFLLSVLGEGSFQALLGFLDQHAPDPITRQVTQLARVDEARHVAFGVAHLQHQSRLDPTLRGRPRAAAERRHDVWVPDTRPSAVTCAFATSPPPTPGQVILPAGMSGCPARLVRAVTSPGHRPPGRQGWLGVHRR